MINLIAETIDIYLYLLRCFFFVGGVNFILLNFVISDICLFV